MKSILSQPGPQVAAHSPSLEKSCAVWRRNKELCAATPCLGITDVEVAMSLVSLERHKKQNGCACHAHARNLIHFFVGQPNFHNFQLTSWFCVLRRALRRAALHHIRQHGARRSLSCRPCLSARLCATVRPVRSCRSPPALREFSATNARCVSHAARHLKGGAGIGRDTHRRAGAS